MGHGNDDRVVAFVDGLGGQPVPLGAQDDGQLFEGLQNGIVQTQGVRFESHGQGDKARLFQIPWARLDSLATLKEAGFVTLAMALKPDALSLDDPVLQAFEKLAVVLGTEGDGLTAETIDECDHTVIIPMAHGVDSLNVGNAAAVAFWTLRKER